jgi:HEPN domain-containing protein
MDAQESRIREIEEYLLFLEGSEGKGANMPVLEKISDWRTRAQEVEYWRYVQSADYHYFVARVLFLKMVFVYSYFSAHQCIENYLKACLRFHCAKVPLDHRLGNLLELCKKASSCTQCFIHSRYAALIARRFDPYYEVGRYPVQKTRPKDGKGAFLWPDDIRVLDYFVYQMRRMVTLPDNTWDILGQGEAEGHYELVACRRHCPDFYNLFKSRNINFPASLTDG